MVYDNLAADTQNFIQYSFLQNSKIVLVILVLVLSLAYLFYFKKYEKKTPYLAVALLRVVFSSLAWVTLFVSPMMVFFLAPEVSFWTVYQIYFWIYSLSGSIFLLVTIAELYYIIPALTLKFANLDMKDKKINEIYRRWFKGNNGY